jgi:hypothetical protein
MTWGSPRLTKSGTDVLDVNFDPPLDIRQNISQRAILILKASVNTEFHYTLLQATAEANEASGPGSLCCGSILMTECCAL